MGDKQISGMLRDEVTCFSVSVEERCVSTEGMCSNENEKIQETCMKGQCVKRPEKASICQLNSCHRKTFWVHKKNRRLIQCSCLRDVFRNAELFEELKSGPDHLCYGFVMPVVILLGLTHPFLPCLTKSDVKHLQGTTRKD